MSESYKRLVEYNIKPSIQRMAIMDYLMLHRTHPSAEEIYTSLFPTLPTLSKTTVHSTLRLFAERGAALMLTIDDRTTNYDADTSLHAHFLCKKCGKIDDLEFTIDPSTMEDFQSQGNRITEMHHYYKGVCKICLEKNID